jgi:multiple sugar transport system permease protein
MNISSTATAERFGWRLITPAYILVTTLVVLPLLFSLYISFHRWDLTVVPNVLRWVGIQNFQSILTSAETWKTLNFTFLYTVLSVAGELLVGLVLSLLLHRITVGRGVFVSLLILPMMMAPIVTGLAWRLMLNPEYGPLNSILGIKGTLWLGDITLAKISVIVATIWQEAPFMMVFLLARLRSLPTEPFEAALIDGANGWQIFRYITLPLLMPVIIVAVLIRLIFEFRAFDIIWILTTGGPAGATETLSLINFRMTFQHFSIGPGAALSWVMLLITSVGVVWYIFVLARTRQEGEP